MKSVFAITAALLLISSIFFLSGPALAIDTIVGNTQDCNCQEYVSAEDCGSDECCKYCIGDYGVSDFVSLLIRISQIILGLTGSLALLAFVYGGFLFLLSAGNKDQVAKGRRVLIGAVIGIIIVFFSYTIIGFVATSLGIQDNIFTAGWQ